MSEDANNFCPSCHEELNGQHCSPCDVPALLNGRYLLKRMLGRGANGYTWLARDTTDNKEYAIKELNVRRMDSFKQLELFEREASVLRALDHPAIPSYYDDFYTEDRRLVSLYLVQEFIDGKALDLKTPRPLPEVMELIRQIAEVLDYLHDLHPPVYHRDIKPSNIMQREDGSYVLIDFGSTRAAIEDTVGGSTVAGTFGYMAPEQFAGRAHSGVDIYGLGATAIALLAGRDASQVIDPQAPGAWQERLNLPEHTADVLARMVHPDPDERVRNARDLLRAGTRERSLEKADDVSVAPTPARDESAARKLLVEKLSFRESEARFRRFFAGKNSHDTRILLGGIIAVSALFLTICFTEFFLVFLVVAMVGVAASFTLDLGVRFTMGRYFDLPSDTLETVQYIDECIASMKVDKARMLRRGTTAERESLEHVFDLGWQQAWTRLGELSDSLLQHGPHLRLPAMGVRLYRSAAGGEPPDLSTLLTYGLLAEEHSEAKFLMKVCRLYTRKGREHAYLSWLVAQHIFRKGDKAVFQEERAILERRPEAIEAKLYQAEEVSVL